MSITAYDQKRFGSIVAVTVMSDLEGTVYYHWYLDGCYVGVTQSPTRSFYVEADEQVRLEVLDTIDADFDPVAGAPDSFPARRTVWWLRSLEADIDHYRVEEKEGAGEWTAIAVVHHDPLHWSYSILTGRLADLTDYQWRVVPVDAAGNDGTAEAIDAERIVRIPDAPDFEIEFDPETTKVTFSEAV